MAERTLLSPSWRGALAAVRTRATQAGAVPRAWLSPTVLAAGDHDLHDAPGVLAGWDRGHMIAAVTGLPTVADHGPSSFASALFMRPAHDEPDQRSVCPRCGVGEAVSFVIVDGHSTFDALGLDAALAGVPLEPLFRRRAVRLDNGAAVEFDLFGAATATWGLRLWQSPFSAPVGAEHVAGGLEHARVVWESRERSAAAFLVAADTAGAPANHAEPVVLRLTPRQADLEKLLLAQPDAVVRTDRGILFGGPVVPSVRVLELVAGATIAVPATAGDVVSLALPLATPHGATTYRQQIVATADVVRFVVPYAASGVPDALLAAAAVQADGGQVVATGPYRITNGSRDWNVAVDEHAVVAGEVVVAR